MNVSPARFGFESLERPTAWVGICSECLGIEKSEAAAMLANMTGYKTWDDLAAHTGLVRPSPTDEMLDSATRHIRYGHYTNVLVDIFAFNPTHAKHLARTFSPSSGAPLGIFSFDRDGMYEPHNEGAVHLGDMFISGEEDTIKEEMFKVLREMMGDDFPSDATPDDLEHMLRTCGPMQPATWLEALESIGWVLDSETYQPDARGEMPTVIAQDEVFGRVSIFCVPFTKTPYDRFDQLALQACEQIAQYLGESWLTPALLLLKVPLVKTIAGKHYCYVGMAYFQNEWREVLMNEACTSFAEMIAKNGERTNVNNPDVRLEDKKHAWAMNVIMRDTAFDDLPEGTPVNICLLKSPSGWNHVVPDLSGGAGPE